MFRTNCEFKHSRFNQKGFSLVEVIIALGLLGVLALGISEVLNLARRSNQSVQISTEWTALKNLVQLILNNDKSCRDSFKFLANPGSYFNAGSFDPNSWILHCDPSLAGSCDLSAVGDLDPTHGVAAGQEPLLKINREGASTPDITVGNQNPIGKNILIEAIGLRLGSNSLNDSVIKDTKVFAGAELRIKAKKIDPVSLKPVLGSNTYLEKFFFNITLVKNSSDVWEPRNCASSNFTNEQYICEQIIGGKYNELSPIRCNIFAPFTQCGPNEFPQVVALAGPNNGYQIVCVNLGLDLDHGPVVSTKPGAPDYANVNSGNLEDCILGQNSQGVPTVYKCNSNHVRIAADATKAYVGDCFELQSGTGAKIWAKANKDNPNPTVSSDYQSCSGGVTYRP